MPPNLLTIPVRSKLIETPSSPVLVPTKSHGDARVASVKSPKTTKAASLRKQKSAGDLRTEHGQSVNAMMSMQNQGNWKAEDFVANHGVELPKHLPVGTRIVHAERGNGTVVNLRSVFPPMVVVEYDAGDTHSHEPGFIQSPLRPVVLRQRTTTAFQGCCLPAQPFQRAGLPPERAAGAARAARAYLFWSAGYKPASWLKLLLLPESHELGAALVGTGSWFKMAADPDVSAPRASEPT